MHCIALQCIAPEHHTGGLQHKVGCRHGKCQTTRPKRALKTGDMGDVGDWVDEADGGVRVTFASCCHLCHGVICVTVQWTKGT